MMSVNVKQEYQLTRGFFQTLAENRKTDIQPVLQIMNSRFTNDDSSVRLRLNDGIFSYATIVLKGKGIEKFKSYGMEKATSIIKLLDYSVNTTQKESIDRIHITINDIEMIQRESSLSGTPVPHPGNAEEYRGIKTENVSQAPLKESSNVKIPLMAGGGSQVVSRGGIKQELAKDDLTVVPITSISPYLMQWKICGVVTDKFELRDVNTAKGSSKVFSFHIADKEGVEIKVACFGELASQLYQSVQVSETYMIKGNNKAVKNSNKRFNSTGHEYEIQMRNDIEVTKCEESFQLPAQKISRVLLSQIKMFPGDWVDVIAVIDSMEDSVNVTTKSGMTKRKVVNLLDPSKTLVRLTIWGNSCDFFTDDMLHKPIILKSALVGQYNGVYNLTYNFKTKIISDDGAITGDLLNWYNMERANIEIANLQPFSDNFSRALTIHAAAARDLSDKSDKPVYFNTFARISHIKENMVYKACSQKDCKKKVAEQDGQYYCAKCGMASDTFKYVFMVSLEVYDHSGSHWMTMFGDKAEELFKKSASQVGEILEAHGDDNGHNMIVGDVLETLRCFNVRSKSEIYNETKFSRWNLIDMKPFNMAKYAEFLHSMYKDAEKFKSKRQF